LRGRAPYAGTRAGRYSFAPQGKIAVLSQIPDGFCPPGWNLMGRRSVDLVGVATKSRSTGVDRDKIAETFLPFCVISIVVGTKSSPPASNWGSAREPIGKPFRQGGQSHFARRHSQNWDSPQWFSDRLLTADARLARNWGVRRGK
jgi:hypothetical protein